MGRATQTIFTRFFVFMIMTVYFWIFSLAGLFVLGIGPALRAVTELYMDGQWDYKNYGFKKGWRLFKQNFWQVNLHAWVFLGIGAVLLANLFMSTRLHLAWMLIIQFIIIFAVIMNFSLGMFTLMIRSHYDVSFKDAVKLATAQFFSNFMQLLMFLLVTAILITVSLKWPGMILFLSPGIYLFAADALSRTWYAKIDDQLEQTA